MKTSILKFALLSLFFLTAPNQIMAQTNQIYKFVELSTPPTYPGGMANFYKLISNNIKYPDAAKKNNIEGTVFVSFVVEKDGSLTDIQALKKLGHGTDEEAIRVMELSEKWTPGKVDGKAVRVQYSLPVKFKLS